MSSDTNKKDIYDIYDRFFHIKKLLTSSQCDTCKQIIRNDCDLVKCEICYKKEKKINNWMCFNCAVYKKKITVYIGIRVINVKRLGKYKSIIFL